MNRRVYRLGRRQASVDRTGAAILDAARQLVAEGGETTVGAIARQAGVSRITVYNRFGSRLRLLQALAPPPVKAEAAGAEGGDPSDLLRQHFERTSAAWAANPGLFRHLPRLEEDPEASRHLVARIAAVDALRPGCSLREAEDVIGGLSSFGMFDRLHKDGRRSPSAVSEILTRLAAGIMA